MLQCGCRGLRTTLGASFLLPLHRAWGLKLSHQACQPGTLTYPLSHGTGPYFFLLFSVVHMCSQDAGNRTWDLCKDRNCS